MKKIVIGLLLWVLILNIGYSQTILTNTKGDTIVYITLDQLKASNLIFLEHQKLLATDSIKTKQIEQYKNVISNYQQEEDFYKEQIDMFTKKSDEDYALISDLNESLTKSKKVGKIKNYIIGALSILVIGLAL